MMASMCAGDTSSSSLASASADARITASEKCEENKRGEKQAYARQSVRVETSSSNTDSPATISMCSQKNQTCLTALLNRLRAHANIPAMQLTWIRSTSKVMCTVHFNTHAHLAQRVEAVEHSASLHPRSTSIVSTRRRSCPNFSGFQSPNPAKEGIKTKKSVYSCLTSCQFSQRFFFYFRVCVILYERSSYVLALHFTSLNEGAASGGRVGELALLSVP